MGRNKKGSILTPKGVIWYDSLAERRVLESINWNAVKSIYRHFPISYTYYGKSKTFLIDFVITWLDGSRTAIEVKGKHLLKLRSTQAKLRAGQLYCAQNSILWQVIHA